SIPLAPVMATRIFTSQNYADSRICGQAQLLKLESAALFRTMTRVRKLFSLAMLVLLAGCTTTPRRESENLPLDWQSEIITNRPAPVRTNVIAKVFVQTNRISEPWVSLARWTRFYSLP